MFALSKFDTITATSWTLLRSAFGTKLPIFFFVKVGLPSLSIADCTSIANTVLSRFLFAIEALGIDYIDESEVLTPADNSYHINKNDLKALFVCGSRNLGEALRRIGEGASMIRTKGEARTGDIVQAVTHMRTINDDIRRVKNTPKEELMTLAKEFNAPYDLIEYVWKNGKLPVINFSVGGIATPADAALMMQLGFDSVFMDSGIFKSWNPEKRARAIVLATTYYNDPIKLAEISEDLGKVMSGINCNEITSKYEERGW